MKQWAQGFFLVAFLGSLFAVPTAIYLLSRDNTVSYYENRMLATIPTYTVEELLAGDYSQDLEDWVADHIPMRDTLLQLNTWSEMYLLRTPVVNDVVIGDTLLGFYEFETLDVTSLDTDAEAAVAKHLDILETIEPWGGTFCYVGITSQTNYFNDSYPEYTDGRGWYDEMVVDLFAQEAESQGMPFLNMQDTFETMGMPEELYAQSDHHYTYYGAYVTYQTIMDYIKEETGLDLFVLSEDTFEIVPLEQSYLGSRNRAIYGMWDGEESLYMGIQTDPVPFTRYDNGVEVEATLYGQIYGDTVTYDFYMGGDKAETWIQTDRAELPNLLIFGDSFTNALETMLYASFNETRSLDLRYYTEQGILEYIAEYQPDVVLCIRDDHSYLGEVGNGVIQ